MLTGKEENDDKFTATSKRRCFLLKIKAFDIQWTKWTKKVRSLDIYIFV